MSSHVFKDSENRDLIIFDSGVDGNEIIDIWIEEKDEPEGLKTCFFTTNKEQAKEIIKALQEEVDRLEEVLEKQREAER